MISEHARFEGFDARGWDNLLSLFRASEADRTAGDGDAAPRARGTLIVVRDGDDEPVAAMVTGRGPVQVSAWDTPEGLQEQTRRVGAARALVVDDGAIEELTERAAERIPMPGDYLSQWLALLSVVRELEEEGRLLFWPPPPLRVPLPTAAMVGRALDLLLPSGHALVVALWDGDELWTGFAMHRREGEIDHIAGPELLQRWAGPLAGDYRRNHRVVQQAVERAMGPVYFGLFADREVIEELLRRPDAGAWARAVALRDVILSPAPGYAHAAVAADAARAAGVRARKWFGGLDLFGYAAPLADFAREHVAHVGSVTSILGFNPLEALAERLTRDEDGRDDEGA
ncbi:MAG: hypothetical protein PVI30_05045 [Myxococcales bacterium]|jgi:hypothetical protein